MGKSEVKKNRSTAEYLQHILFYIGEEMYGLSILNIDEIIKPKSITAIPRTPEYFLGIINLRGEVISIIDMRTRFGLSPLKSTGKTKIIVIHSRGVKLGLLVDEIKTIIPIPRVEIYESEPTISTERQKYLEGSYKLPNGQILLLLRNDKIIDEEDFQVHQEVSGSHEGIQLEEEEQGQLVKDVFLAGFSVGEERYALESRLVEEIIILPKLVTIVPDMEEFVEGIFHLRDSVIPLIRFGKRLGISTSSPQPEDLVIIVNILDIKVGLRVEKVIDVLTIKETEVLPAPITLNQKQSEQLHGVIRRGSEEDPQIVMFLRLDRLFSIEERDQLRELNPSKEQSNEISQKKDDQFPIVEFILAGEKYAISVLSANEVLSMQEIVPVPKSPNFVAGIINLRGEVISVIDLPLLAGNPDYKINKNFKILVVKTQKLITGLIIEKVLGIRHISKSKIEPPSDFLEQREKIQVQGIGRDDDDQILILIDIEKTLLGTQKDEISEEILNVQKELELLEQEDHAEKQFLLEMVAH